MDGGAQDGASRRPVPWPVFHAPGIGRRWFLGYPVDGGVQDGASRRPVPAVNIEDITGLNVCMKVLRT